MSFGPVFLPGGGTTGSRLSRVPVYPDGGAEAANGAISRISARMSQRPTFAQRQATGAGTTALTDLVQKYNEAYQQAKAANEARYQQLLGITEQTTGQREADIRQAYGQQGAQIGQSLARSGLAGTTAAPTMQMGVAREQESALNRLADQMQQTKLGIIERREDRYPELGMISQLAGALGQAGGAGGISGLFKALGGLQLG